MAFLFRLTFWSAPVMPRANLFLPPQPTEPPAPSPRPQPALRLAGAPA